MVVTQARMQANSTTGRGETGFVGGNATNKLKRITAGEWVEGFVGGNAGKDASQQYHRQRRDRRCWW